jgi:glycolate oxidase FAD binding subunit
VAAAVRAMEAGVPSAVICRAGSGAVYGYWESVGGAAGTMIADVRGAIGGMRGSVVVEKAPPALKGSTDVWGVEGPDVELMRRIKAAYDPGGVLSPGRLV